MFIYLFVSISIKLLLPVWKLPYFALFKKRLGPNPKQAAGSKNLCNGPDKVRIQDTDKVDSVGDQDLLFAAAVCFDSFDYSVFSKNKIQKYSNLKSIKFGNFSSIICP